MALSIWINVETKAAQNQKKNTKIFFLEQVVFFVTKKPR